MSLLRRIIYGKDPARMFIKKKAHAFTILTVVWCFFSLIAVMFYREGRAGRDEAGVYVAIVAWSLHLLILSLTIWLWLKETPKEVDVIETSADIR